MIWSLLIKTVGSTVIEGIKNYGERKKIEREKLGSVNLRADEETKNYKTTIEKMEKDREDLVSAISKLRSSINELNQKGRERLLEILADARFSLCSCIEKKLL